MKPTPEQLRERLEGLGINQRQFARLTGSTPMTVSNWMTNRHPIPRWVGLVLELLEILPAAIRKRLLRQRLTGGDDEPGADQE
jgi:transcriptional regulator with XRE-family HTH domain